MKLSTSAMMAAATALLAGVDAHMIISKPVPFKFENEQERLSPLAPSGSDFPCKQPAGSYQAQTTNTIPVGIAQPLTFTGSAIHGGGSCQISITKDLKPTKSSKWKVVHSIIGGCPMSAEGNLSPENPNGSVDSGLNFTLPEDLADGAATLAWTWFNKVGNREMYMNCAPIEITGGKGDDAFFDSLPDMFRANEGSCKVPEGTAIVDFPNPGQSVLKLLGNGEEAKQPKCEEGSGPALGSSAAAGSSGSASSGSGAAGSGAGASSGSGSSDSGASAASSSATPVNTGGVFAAGAGSGSASSASSAPASSSIAASAPVAAPSTGTGSPSGAVDGSSSNGSSSGSAGGSTGTCSTADAGKTLCNGDSMFGTCDQLGQVVWRPVAQGTVCKDGTIAAAAAKRHVRFSKHHIRRGHHFV